MLSDFLVELDAIGEALGLDSTETKSDDGAQTATPSSASFRNIDILLMDDTRFKAGRERNYQVIFPSFDTLSGRDTRRRMLPALWTLVQSGCSACWAFTVARIHLDRLGQFLKRT
jgi:hypothetical protein